VHTRDDRSWRRGRWSRRRRRSSGAVRDLFHIM
jgi:hypothetical protein